MCGCKGEYKCREMQGEHSGGTIMGGGAIPVTTSTVVSIRPECLLLLLLFLLLLLLLLLPSPPPRSPAPLASSQAWPAVTHRSSTLEACTSCAHLREVAEGCRVGLQLRVAAKGAKLRGAAKGAKRRGKARV